MEVLAVAMAAVLAGTVGPGGASTEASTRASIFLATVRSAERLLLPGSGPIELRVDPLRARLELGAARDLPAITEQLGAAPSWLCPDWQRQGERLLLTCRTRRLQARVIARSGRRYLDVQELRGLPRGGEEDRLEVFYDPPRAGLGGPCPGTTPAGRGECALAAGDRREAERQWLLALRGDSRTLAALRLGDLAEAAGDLAAAVRWWLGAGTEGPFGRLAAARLCELRGGCGEGRAGRAARLFDAGELPEPMGSELALRGARLAAFAGDTGALVQRIEAVLSRGSGDGACVTQAERMCRRLLLSALEDGGGDETGRRALESYLRLPRRPAAPYHVALARAAAARAAALGAPVFAGHLQASVLPEVAAGEVEDHLAETAGLYLKGGDRPRARVVLEYTEARLGVLRASGTRWRALRAQLEEPPLPPEADPSSLELAAAEAARDLASAALLLARRIGPREAAAAPVAAP
jgi:hypothetical protein